MTDNLPKSNLLTSVLIECIKSKLPIADVAEEYVDDLTAFEDGLYGTCPICEGVKSFYVYPNIGDTKRNDYFCVNCSKEGDVIDLIKNIENVDMRDALKIILSRYAGL